AEKIRLGRLADLVGDTLPTKWLFYPFTAVMITENLGDTISFEQRRPLFYNIHRIKGRTYLANHVDHDLLLRRPRLMSDRQRHRGIAAATWIDEAEIREAWHWRPFLEIAHASL